MLFEFLKPSTRNTQTPSTSASPTSSQSQLPLPTSSSPTRWDVFLSFRGTDTRYNFTSHLYDKLDSNRFGTFMDDPELRTGENISEALIRAIYESKTYIVVFSENYASSKWCLDELVEIYKCHKSAQRLVIPVFYKIDASVIRYQIGSFKDAFEKHQARYEMEMVNEWRLTLKEVADLSGEPISASKDRSEANVVNKIVDVLLLQINPKTLHVAKYPVGLDSRVKDLSTLLSSDTEGVIKFGIFGMGGVGKTTLAKALFNQLLRGGSFKGSCFLANVREASGTFNGLESLQQKLINDVLNSTTKVEVHSVEQGINLIRERISSTKVLLLIDDIYDLEQYESLAGPFATGSVVIITTRDEEMLDKVSVEPEYRYKLKELDGAQSRELFTKYAFEKAEPTENLLALSEDILGLAGGLPLALKIFGSYLSTKKEGGWKSYIETLQQYPNSTIEQKLLISLDALELDDRMLKKIFIDIACFFVGWNIEEAVEVLGTYYSHIDDKMDILKKRCLLTVDEEELEMHDLLRDMGRNVARNKAYDEPGKYTRLWLPEDIKDVLKNHKGTESIEGIIPHKLYSKDAPNGLSFTTKTFKKMSKLRFLHLEEVNITGSFERIFEDLRVLVWHRCPLECLPFDFCPEKIVILKLPQSNMKRMWHLNTVSQVFEKLKTLNMSHSQHLTTTPDFTILPCLETLHLEYCESLEEVHMSIGSLARLNFLNLNGCKRLRSLDTICNLRALKVLKINNCGGLKSLPIQLGNIESLTKLSAQSLSVSKLPDSIGYLSKLLELDLRYNDNLTTLPSGFSQLSNLTKLDISCCNDLLFVRKLPPNLKRIDANHCYSLKRLPNLSSLKHLEDLNLGNGSGLTCAPGLEDLISIRKLDLRGCTGLVNKHLIKQFFKVYSKFGHQINIFVSEYLDQTSRLWWSDCIDESPNGEYSESQALKRRPRWSDWILESPYWTSEHSESTDWSNEYSESKVHAELLPNESHNFMGIILCFSDPNLSCVGFGCSLKNTRTGFIWSSRFDVPRSEGYDWLMMVIVPKSTFSVTDNDNAIELTADKGVNTVGVHLLYET
ncbi:hypothetical protein AgCh_039915 [Apium graveolens]